jgi:hypothetical protein
MTQREEIKRKRGFLKTSFDLNWFIMGIHFLCALQVHLFKGCQPVILSFGSTN